MRKLIVSIHDVHPSSFEACRQQVMFCESLGIHRFSILAVPDFHLKEPIEDCPKLVKWLQEREGGGDEIVLHGYYHANTSQIKSPSRWFWNRIYTTNEAEFIDMDFAVARSRIARGLERFRGAGLHPVGFVAPAWLLNQDVIRAVFDLGFSYTNTLTSIMAASGSGFRTQSLCYSSRAALRRQGSVAWNAFLWRKIKGNHVVRLSLHPLDLEYAPIQRQISAILRSSIELQYESTTYRDFVNRSA